MTGTDRYSCHFYSTGGGTGLIGMWKAFNELEEMGGIGPKRPRMVSVQAEAWSKLGPLPRGCKCRRRSGIFSSLMPSVVAKEQP